MNRTTLRQAHSATDYALAAELFNEYAKQLGVDLCFQGFAAELQSLANAYGPPAGCLLLAKLDGHPVGCVGVRQFAAGQCELKRLYVRDSARGHGVGMRLIVAAIQAARSAGYQCILLDTLASMTAARQLYVTMGFREIAPYYNNPLQEVTYMALDLN
jgi:putative acetyltransferase